MQPESIQIHFYFRKLELVPDFKKFLQLFVMKSILQLKVESRVSDINIAQPSFLSQNKPTQLVKTLAHMDECEEHILEEYRQSILAPSTIMPSSIGADPSTPTPTSTRSPAQQLQQLQQPTIPGNPLQAVHM